MKKIKVFIKILVLAFTLSPFSPVHAFSNGNIACTLSDGTVVNFDVNNCSARTLRWVEGGLFPHGMWGVDFSMTGTGILNSCISRNGRRTLHLDHDRIVIYYGKDSDRANCKSN